MAEKTQAQPSSTMNSLWKQQIDLVIDVCLSRMEAPAKKSFLAAPGETNHLSFRGWEQVDQIIEVLKISQVFNHLQIQCVQAERKANKLLLKRWAGRRNRINWSLDLSLSSADKSLLKLNQIKNLTTEPKENPSHDLDHHPSLACRILSHMKLLKWQNQSLTQDFSSLLLCSSSKFSPECVPCREDGCLLTGAYRPCRRCRRESDLLWIFSAQNIFSHIIRKYSWHSADLYLHFFFLFTKQLFSSKDNKCWSMWSNIRTLDMNTSCNYLFFFNDKVEGWTFSLL